MSSSGKSIEPLLVTPLRSPAARKRVRAQAQLAWRRTAVRLLVGGVVAAGLVRLGAIAAEPLVATYRSGRDIQALETRYRDELGRRKHLQHEIQFLSTNAGIEEEARRLGWVKDGETSIQILTPSTASTAPAPETLPAKKLSGSERVKQWLNTWLSVLHRAPVKGDPRGGSG
jgi:cell division protein FtsB